MATCIVEDCYRQAQPRNELCSGHLRRRQLEKDVHVPLDERFSGKRSAWDRVIDAATAVLECDSENDREWERVYMAYRQAMKAYCRVGQLKARIRELEERVAELEGRRSNGSPRQQPDRHPPPVGG